PTAAATAAPPTRPISSARRSQDRHRVRSSEGNRIRSAPTTPPTLATSCSSLSAHRPAAGKQADTAVTGSTHHWRASHPAWSVDVAGHRPDVLPTPPTPFATPLKKADEGRQGR